jgi:Skp family chaperone for outer membrane proteins
MKKTTLVIVVMAGLVVAAWGLRGTGAAQEGDEPELKLGLVKVTQVLTECQEYLDRDKKMKQKEQEIRTELSRLREESETIRQELENALTPASDEYMNRLKEWFDKKYAFESLKEYQKESLTTATQAWTENLYEKFLSEVAGVARQKGLTLVLNKDETDMKSRNVSELSAMIVNRKVLYNAANFDITALVIERMDMAYDKEKAAKGTEVTPETKVTPDIK